MNDDRTDVIDATVRMAWLADRRNWEALVEVFTDHVAVDYSSLTGQPPADVGRSELVEGWRTALAGLTATQHLVGNHLLSIEGDTAEVTATFQATHVLANASGGSTWTLGGHYRYRLARTVEGWRIAGVTMTADWATGNRHIMTLATEGA